MLSTSAGDGTFGLDKLSLGAGKVGGDVKEEDVGAEGARDSVNFLQIGNEDEGYLPNRDSAKPNSKISTASAALDLAPLAQTSQRFPHRAFDTGLKTSEWPQFSGVPKSANDAAAPRSGSAAPAGITGPSSGQTPITSRRESPTGPTSGPDMATSISSLPPMPTRSATGTPGAPMTGSGLGAFSNYRKNGPGGPVPAGIAGGQALEGLSASQRGFSNPDLAKAFQKVGTGFGSIASGPRSKKPYGQPDPLYAGMEAPGMAPLGGPQFGGYDSYGFEDDNFGPGGLYPAGGMGMRSKKADLEREYNRFTGMRLEDLQGEILSLSKDQHGCRYLQKKLEEELPEHRDMIFRETYGHFPELMTDPFGNYLCQKLLEYSTEEQRNVICESVANDLVGISLNMHGTRAVQKMIDFLSNPRQPNQIRSIILALSLNVVALIKDLNGNHVIQKCLNRLIPEDNQFIYNAVAAHCVEVATHRHGCCVLQRCIDHATDSQRVQLVTEITFHALTLVQDPFGNYVVQYVLDLNDVRFSEPLIRQFAGNVCVLSVQKFSSNVIEKCIRVADPELRKTLVSELLSRGRLEKLLRDSFANYVVQTALDYADPAQRVALVDHIRPILPMIRNTPYGKRIQSKLQREQHGHQDHYGGSGYHGQQSMMNLGMNNYGNGYGGPNGGHSGGRGGYHSHSRHMGGHPNMHQHGMNEMYGPGQGMGGYGGYQGAMGGGYDMGYQQHLAQQQFAGPPSFGQNQAPYAANNANEASFGPAGFNSAPVEQGDAAAMNGGGNLGMLPLENPGLTSFPPQQGYPPYM